MTHQGLFARKHHPILFKNISVCVQREKKRCSRMKNTEHRPVAGSILTLSYQCILQLYIMSDLFVFIPLYELYTWWDLSVHERHRFNKRNVSNVHLKDLSKLKLYRPFPSRFQELRHEI